MINSTDGLVVNEVTYWLGFVQKMDINWVQPGSYLLFRGKSSSLVDHYFPCW